LLDKIAVTAEDVANWVWEYIIPAQLLVTGIVIKGVSQVLEDVQNACANILDVTGAHSEREENKLKLAILKKQLDDSNNNK